MTQEEKIKEIIRLSNTNQVYGVVDFNALHESLHEDLKEMAKWKEEQLIEKAIGWIDYNNENGGCNFDEWEKDFKKAMEE